MLKNSYLAKIIMGSALLAAAGIGCGDEADLQQGQSGSKPAAELEPPAQEDSDLLPKVIGALPLIASPDVQSRVITAFVSTLPHGVPASWSVKSLFQEGIVDNYGAVVMAAAVAQELGWEWQTVVLDCQPGTRWFLEVNTYDGRFLLDPYHGRVATAGGANDPVLPFPDAFQTGIAYRYTGPFSETTHEQFLANWTVLESTDMAAWNSSFEQACLASRYTPSRSMLFPIVANAADPFTTYGTVNQSPWDVDAAFAAPGETRSDHAFLGGYHSPAGPIVFGYRVVLTNTVPGTTYRFSIRSVEENPGILTAVSAEAKLSGFHNLGNQVFSLGIEAVSDRTEVLVGMNSRTALSVDAMALGEFAEGTWP